MIGLETTLALCLTHLEELSLSQIFCKLATNPARLLGIRGGDATDWRACRFVALRHRTEVTIREEEMRSKSKNTAFHEVEVRGVVMKTWVDGRIVFDREKEQGKEHERTKAKGKAKKKGAFVG